MQDLFQSPSLAGVVMVVVTAEVEVTEVEVTEAVLDSAEDTALLVVQRAVAGVIGLIITQPQLLL